MKPELKDGLWTDLTEKLGNLRAQLVEIEKSLQSTENALAELSTAAPSLGSKRFARTIRQLSSHPSQDSILDGLLTECQDYVERGIFFVRGLDTWRAVKSIGFSSEEIKDLEIDSATDPVIEAAARKVLIHLEGLLSEKLTWLSSGAKSERYAACIPLVFQDTVPLVFYGDSKDPLDVGSLEFLLELAVLVLQNHFLSHLVSEAGSAGEILAVESPEPTEPASEESGEVKSLAEAPSEELGLGSIQLIEPFAGTSASAEPSSPGAEASLTQHEVPLPGEEEIPVSEVSPVPPEEDRAQPQEAAAAAGATVSPDSAPEDEVVEVSRAGLDEPSISAPGPTEIPEAESPEEAREESGEEYYEELSLDEVPPEPAESLEPEAPGEVRDEVEAQEEYYSFEEGETGETTREDTLRQEFLGALKAERIEFSETPSKRHLDLSDFGELDLDRYELSDSDLEIEPEEAFQALELSKDELEGRLPDSVAEETEEEEGRESREAPKSDLSVAPPEQTHGLAAEEREILHAEARRFARLLVTEIKLYNENDVVQGRGDATVYSRLRDEIERSREMYQKRAHAAVQAEIDYFHNELLRILAQDNADLMGPDYPGPHLSGPGSRDF